MKMGKTNAGLKTHILLVEGPATAPVVGRRGLEDCGYTVTHVSTGEEGVRVLLDPAASFDLVLVDVDLDGTMDGVATAQAILSRRSIPVIFLTARTDRSAVERIAGVASVGCVVKDTGIAILDTAIRTALRIHTGGASPGSISEMARGPAWESQLLDCFFSQSMYGFLLTMLDEPVEWDEETDKSAALDYIIGHERIVRVNEAMLEQYGSREEDMVGQSLEARFSGMGRDNLRAAIQQVNDQGRCLIETRERRADGTPVVIVGDYVSLRDHQGRIVGHFGAQVDITGRKAMEDQLRSLSDNIPGGTVYQVVLNEDGKRRFTYVSAGVERIFGVTPRQVLDNAETIYGAYLEEDLERVAAAEACALRTQAPFYIEARIRRSDGEIRWIQAQSSLRRMPDNSIVADGVCIDITERKAAEDSLLKEEALVRVLLELATGFINTPQDRFETAVQAMLARVGEFTGLDRVYIFMHDLERQVTSNTHEWCGEGIAPQMENLQNIPFSDFAEWHAAWEAGDIVHIPSVAAMPGELATRRILKMQGIESLVAIPLVDGEGILGFVGFDAMKTGRVFSDREIELLRVLAEIVSNALARHAAEKEVRRLVSEKETLLTEVHHRVKNNITAIAALLRLSAEEAVGEEAQATLRNARGRLESMRSLYDRLLLERDYSALSAKTYLEELVAAILELAPGKQRPFVTVTAEDVQLDVKQLFPLGLVVNELVTNALKYAFAESTGGSVDISLHARDGSLELVVRDDGTGLPASYNRESSTGFGLTLVEMLADQLRGSFRMESEGGLVSTLQFPLR